MGINYYRDSNEGSSGSSVTAGSTGAELPDTSGVSGAQLANKESFYSDLNANVWGQIQGLAGVQASAMDWSNLQYAAALDTSYNPVTTAITKFLDQANRFGQDLDFYMNTAEGFDMLVDHAWNVFVGQNPSFTADRNFRAPGGGGGGGARGPTAQDIRNSFDIDQLSQAAEQIWQAMLWDTPEDSRAMASAYIETMVKHMGKKKIDFTAHVRKEAMKTARFKELYKNKPDGIAPEEFLGQYVALANQYLRPENREEYIGRGARLGASQQQFGQALAKSDEYTGSAPFITGMEQRLQNVSKVLRA